MPMADSSTAKAFKENFDEFYNEHKFGKGTDKKAKIKQALAVASSVKRKAALKKCCKTKQKQGLEQATTRKPRKGQFHTRHSNGGNRNGR